MVGENQKSPCDRVFWVASYPRSGNTLTRMLLGQVVFGLDGTFSTINEAMPYHPGEGYRTARPTDTRFGPSILLKTHAPVCPALPGTQNAGVYLYRHPLDVFLSSYNYCYLTKEEKAFKGGICKSVDEIVRDGELDYYFDEFLEFGGVPAFEAFAGSWIGNVTHWRTLSKEKPTQFMAVRYEDFISQYLTLFPKIIDTLGININQEETEKALSTINDTINKKISSEETRDMARGFFWKMEMYYYKKYISESNINKFEQKYGDIMNDIGYL